MPKQKLTAAELPLPKRAKLAEESIDEERLCLVEPMFTCLKCIVSGSLTKMICHLSEQHGPLHDRKYQCPIGLQSFQCTTCKMCFESMPHVKAHYCNDNHIPDAVYERLASAYCTDLQHLAKGVGDMVWERCELLLVSADCLLFLLAFRYANRLVESITILVNSDPAMFL